MQKNRLGRGLDVLLSQHESVIEDSPSEAAPTRVDPSLIVANPKQPRQVFDDGKIEELAGSIEASGMLQPLVVRATADGYELIAGERRLRAARRLGMSEVPIIINEMTDPNSLLLALIENLQREDLNPIEEATAFNELQEQFSLTQEQVAEKVGRSRSAVANAIRLLSLPDQIKERISRGELAAGQARALLGLRDRSTMDGVAREVLAKDLSTRDTEALVKRVNGPKRGNAENRLDANLSYLIETLQRHLGTRVRLMHRVRDDKGKLEIEYYSQDDLERITSVMMGSG